MALKIICIIALMLQTVVGYPHVRRQRQMLDNPPMWAHQHHGHHRHEYHQYHQQHNSLPQRQEHFHHHHPHPHHHPHHLHLDPHNHHRHQQHQQYYYPVPVAPLTNQHVTRTNNYDKEQGYIHEENHEFMQQFQPNIYENQQSGLFTDQQNSEAFNQQDQHNYVPQGQQLVNENTQYADTQQTEDTQLTEDFGQQTDFEFGAQQSQQEVQKPEKFTDTQQTEDFGQQTDLEFGSQQSYNTFHKLGKKIDTQETHHNNPYEKSVPNARYVPSQNYDLPSSQNKKPEKDPYDCLSLKVDQLEQEINKQIPESTSTKPLEIQPVAGESSVVETSFKSQKPENSQVFTTNQPPEEIAEENTQKSFWQRVKSKVAETYVKARSEATEIVKKVKSNIPGVQSAQ